MTRSSWSAARASPGFAGAISSACASRRPATCRRPWMTFQDDLQRAGLDPAAIAGRRVRPMARNLEAYRRGTVDVVQVFEPHADRLVSEGRGHVWHRFSERGDIAYTTFYATRRFTRARREACRRLVRGIARAQAALFAATPRALADAVGGFLPKLAPEALARIIGAYRASGLWAATPDLPPAPFLRLKAALVSGGLIRSDPPYERIVDPELSQNDRCPNHRHLQTRHRSRGRANLRADRLPDHLRPRLPARSARARAARAVRLLRPAGGDQEPLASDGRVEAARLPRLRHARPRLHARPEDAARPARDRVPRSGRRPSRLLRRHAGGGDELCAEPDSR